jgi:hypothetical protein
MVDTTQPEIVVHRLEGMVKQSRRRYVLDAELSTPERKRYKMEDYEAEIPAGFLCVFPRKGHAIRVDQEELDRIRDRMVDPRGMVESENVGNYDNSAIMRAAGGNPLINVIQQVGGKK